MAGKESDASHVSFSKVKLTNFRSYDAFSLNLPPGLVVITGENGAGKTNLLEALSLFSPGRGLRRAKLAAMHNTRAGSGFSVFADLVGPDGTFSMGAGVDFNDSDVESTRKIRINGAPAKNSGELLDWLRIMWMTPAMDGLFTGPAADRRRFLDRMVLAIDTDHARRTIAYEKSMRNRNRLLTDNIRDDRWFAAIEHEMSESAVAIAAARCELVRLLQEMAVGSDGQQVFPHAVLALSGTLEEEIAKMPAVELEQDYAARLARERDRDRAAGRTLAGPHRSDLEVTHGPKAMPAALCSTGEQKALLTGLILSHARLTAELSGMAPILLLDEIAAHFDPGRRAALFGIIEDMDCQAFMTGTELAPFSDLKNRAGFIEIGQREGLSEKR